MKPFILLAYLAAIVAANVVTASFAPIPIGALLVPAGSFLIGATFILRDFVQRAFGRRRTYAAILAALALSAATSYALGDTLLIVFASAVTFLVSETLDTETYTRLKLPMASRVFFSGLVGGFVDSALFVVIGLSPIGAGFLPWDAVGFAIAGQILVKTAMQALGAAVIAFTPLARETER
ncbi:VUT family protein [Paenibacillus antri]|uniref:VUT family protein n=1 Tax=Paenibacillus antri TaxID=2582848 RepID=A0A5R9G487_9BACL|nr:VUT family protein [Paenibacillus antri]TLS48950.1 VUT family protein [Paenibacillus antri]